MKTPGTTVKVNDTHIHIYSIPQAAPQARGTLIFLSGSGTECPTYDFKPLWSRLTGQYSMAVVERPGYGWSGQTQLPRDIDTVLEETRAALGQAGVTGPFIPVPHSLAGLEALYWTQKYPAEVAAIIGLDMAVPQVYDSLRLPKTLALQVRLAHLLRRPIAKAMVKRHPAVKGGLLDAQERAAMETIAEQQLLSQNMVDEIGYVRENARKVAGGPAPSVPVLCCLSTDPANLKRIPAWGQAHRDYFAGNSRAVFLELTCGHYVYREAPETVADSICLFLQ